MCLPPAYATLLSRSWYTVKGSFQIPRLLRLGVAGFDPIPATPEAELGRIVKDLSERKQAWASTPNKERAQLLRQCLDTTLEVLSIGSATMQSLPPLGGVGRVASAGIRSCWLPESARAWRPYKVRAAQHYDFLA